MLLFSDCTAQFRRFTSERNSFMKRFHKSVAFLLCLCLLLGAFAPMASAASAPSIVCTTDGMTLIDGTTENMIFTITRAYPSEKYVVDIYNASGISVAYSEGEVDQDTARVDLYLPLENDGDARDFDSFIPLQHSFERLQKLILQQVNRRSKRCSAKHMKNRYWIVCRNAFSAVRIPRHCRQMPNGFQTVCRRSEGIWQRAS